MLAHPGADAIFATRRIVGNENLFTGQRQKVGHFREVCKANSSFVAITLQVSESAVAIGTAMDSGV